MKKFRFLLWTLMLALTTVVFTSCDDDSSIAYTLEGTWEGNMYISSSYSGRVYNAAYSAIDFERDPYRYSSGRGYWVDYYSNAPWDYVANHIRWTVENRVIYILFEEEGVEFEIYDYRLTDNHFRGWLRDGNHNVEFDLVHTSSPNWGSYRYGFGGYYGKAMLTDDIEVQATDEKPVRMLRQ